MRQTYLSLLQSLPHRLSQLMLPDDGINIMLPDDDDVNVVKVNATKHKQDQYRSWQRYILTKSQ